MSRVSADIDVQLADAGQTPVPLRARLSYATTDPLAVRAEFFHRTVRLACWHFDRQTLTEGLHRPAGGGDAFFRPVTTAAHGRTVRMELHGRNTHGPAKAVFLADAPSLDRFLERTRALVPPGTEDVDVDALLDALLAG